MLGVSLMAYLFYEMDEKLKDVPTSKGELKEDQWQYGESYTSNPKKRYRQHFGNFVR
jgi:hypothetical protein